MPLIQRQPINSIVILEVFNNSTSLIFSAKNPSGADVRSALNDAVKTADSLIVVYDAGKVLEFTRSKSDPNMATAIGHFMKKMYAARDVLKMAKACRHWSITNAKGCHISIAERPDGRYFMRYQVQGGRVGHWRAHEAKLINDRMTWEGETMSDLSEFPVNILLPI